MADFVPVTDAAGNRRLVPAQWVGHPVIGEGLTPVGEAAPVAEPHAGSPRRRPKTPVGKAGVSKTDPGAEPEKEK